MTPLHRAWTDGVIQGLREYAWWHNKIQYVGRPYSEGCKTLEVAIEKAESVWADEDHPNPSPCTEDDE